MKNIVELEGVICGDESKRALNHFPKSNDAYLRFSIQWGEPNSVKKTFFSVTAYKEVAEALDGRLKNGQLVTVEGHLSVWKGKYGNNMEIRCDRITLNGKGSTAKPKAKAEPAPEPTPQAEPEPEPSFEMSDTGEMTETTEGHTDQAGELIGM